MDNYELLVEKIARSAGIEKEEVERKIEAKKAKLSGLISKEGAAQIVAAELGINFENELFKISELVLGMKKVNVIAKIINLFPIREYKKNDREGKVANLIIADETGNMRAVLWDTNHISLIEKGEIKLDDVIEIRNAGMRDSELHLSGFSEIKKSSIVIENVKKDRTYSEKKISELQEGQPAKVRGVIVQLFPPRFFTVCPECGKKAVKEADGYVCQEHGKVAPKERALINFVLDDGSETIRAVLFSEQINKIANEEELKIPEKVEALRKELLGTEFYISGSVKKNQLFNNIELSVYDISKVDVDKLVEELEKN
jgi:replication factor A1